MRFRFLICLWAAYVASVQADSSPGTTVLESRITTVIPGIQTKIGAAERHDRGNACLDSGVRTSRMATRFLNTTSYYGGLKRRTEFPPLTHDKPTPPTRSTSATHTTPSPSATHTTLSSASSIMPTLISFSAEQSTRVSTSSLQLPLTSSSIPQSSSLSPTNQQASPSLTNVSTPSPISTSSPSMSVVSTSSTSNPGPTIPAATGTEPTDFLYQLPTAWPYERFGVARRPGQTAAWTLTHPSSFGEPLAVVHASLLWYPRPFDTNYDVFSDYTHSVLTTANAVSTSASTLVTPTSTDPWLGTEIQGKPPISQSRIGDGPTPAAARRSKR